MHPILSDKRKRTIYVIIWTVLGVVSGFILSEFNGGRPLSSMGFTLPMMLLYGEVNLSAWYIGKAFPLEKTPLWKVLLIAASTVIIVSAAWSILGWGALSAVEDIFGVTLMPFTPMKTLMILMFVGQPLFLASLAVNYLIAAFERTKESEHDAYEARILAQNAELKALRMQIDPHFLFNSLNSISALTSTDPQLARTMTTTLADFFRKSLSYGTKRTITLKEELALLDDYLAIEKVRFGRRLAVDLRIDSASLGVHIPALLLQPLVENAIKHGIANSLDGGTIVIASQQKNDRLFITVENPMEDDAPKGKGAGMGMEIVRQRLQAVYGSDGGLKKTAAEGTFSVIVFLPIRS